MKHETHKMEYKYIKNYKDSFRSPVTLVD
jgi:hypothetical protein